MLQGTFTEFDPGMGINRKRLRAGIARLASKSRCSTICFAGFLKPTRGTQGTGANHLGNKLTLSTELAARQSLVSHVQRWPHTALTAKDKRLQGTNACRLLLTVGFSQIINQSTGLTELAPNRMNPAIDDSEAHAPFQ